VVTTPAVRQLADLIAAYERQGSGAKVIVRFAEEMNGAW
jgi:hypothetical protein